MEGRDLWLELPVEVKAKIFDGIPTIKMLISLKTVCKDWNFVISSFSVPALCPPSPRAPLWGLLCFEDKSVIGKGIALNYNPIVTNSFGFKFTNEVSLVEKRVLSLTPSAYHKIQDCCNGMILFTSSSNRQYYVGNPITRQRFHVPASPITRPTTHSSLVFDPSLFLCDEKDPFFKIVSFIRPAQQATVGRPMEVDIYSSDKAKWCTHVVALEPHLYGFEWLQPYLYFNRALYSLSVAMYLVCIDNIIPANNSDLRAAAIPLPDKDEVNICGCFGNCSGQFYYSNRNAQGSFILVWMLGNSKWELMHKISISQDIGFYKGDVHSSKQELKIFVDQKVASLKRHDYFRPRLFLPNDDNGMSILIGPRAFLSYNLETKGTEFQILPDEKNMWMKDKLKVDNEKFFPFSPCPLLFKSPGTWKLVHVPYSDKYVEDAKAVEPAKAVEQSNGSSGRSTVNWCGVSCVVGFIYCVVSFII